MRIARAIAALGLAGPIWMVGLGASFRLSAAGAQAAEAQVAAAPVNGAGVETQAAGTVTPVKVVNFDYGPNRLTVNVGTTVAWTNGSDRPHTVTDRGGTFDSQPVMPGHVASVKFSVPGSYFYFCRINPAKMNGVIVVRAGSQPTAVTRIQAIDPANIAGERFRFDPNSLTVPAGTTLLVADVGGKPHTVTADDGSFTTGIITPGAEGGRFAGTNAIFTITRPGTYAFHCEIHPTLMKGVMTVTGSPASQPPPPPSSAAQQGSINAVDFAFNPTQLAVAPGAKLTFSNRGQEPHTVTFDDVNGDTGIIQSGTSGRLTAPLKPGSYSYHCAVHPAKMRGVLVVLGQNVADPTAPAAVAKPAVAAIGQGPGGRVSTLVLATGILGAFLGGLGISPFLNRRRANHSG
jgi:plastocyanin